MVVVSDIRPTPAPVLVAFDPPADQRRPTVVLRLVLALPHLIVLTLLGLVSLVVVVVGWSGALVLGRLPVFAADFLSGFLRWQTRVHAYLFLLTDRYPPFSLNDSAYPVRLTTRPVPLNRWSVAARLFLAVPALVVAATATYGIATVVLVVTWCIVLISGRLPESLHETFAAFVRYEARLAGYLAMVTSEYPWGLLGDPDPPAPSAPPAAAGLLGPEGSAPWQPVPPSPVHDPYWRLVLTGRAKNTIVFVLVLGVASVVTVNIANAVSRLSRLHTEEAAGTRVHDAYQSLSGAVIRYQSETSSCGATVRPLDCLTGAALMVSAAFTDFVRSVSATPVPPSATSARGALVVDGTHAQRDFAQLSASNSAGRYQLVIESTDLPQLLARFDRDYEELGTELNLG